MNPTKPRLFDQISQAMHLKQYSIHTKISYLKWIKQFILFHNKRHPQYMDVPEIETYLNYLVTDKNVAPATQSVAFNAIMFLYKHVIEKGLTGSVQALRVQQKKQLPVVLTRDEVTQIIDNLTDVYKLIVQLIYGCGMRLSEVLSLRVKDIDFDNHHIIVRDRNGDQDRITMLPKKLEEPLRNQLNYAKALHDKDLAEGFGNVYLPYALEKQYFNANKEWIWQYVLPSHKLSKDPRSGKTRRNHVHKSMPHSHIKKATRTAGIDKKVSSHTFRHSFATHLFEDGYDIHTIQELLGHKDISTTMIYTRILNKSGIVICSPIDSL